MYYPLSVAQFRFEILRASWLLLIQLTLFERQALRTKIALSQGLYGSVDRLTKSLAITSCDISFYKPIIELGDRTLKFSLNDTDPVKAELNRPTLGKKVHCQSEKKTIACCVTFWVI